jgi:probable HAF family extracellular repeat protein
MKLLALLPRATISLAIAALTYFSAISPSAAVVYTISELGQLPGAISSSATAINDMGQVVGSTTFSNGSIHATIWNGTTPTDLGTLPGATLSSAMGISNSGQVVGVSYTAGGPAPPRAVLWSGGVPINLGTLPGGSYSSGVQGINNKGQVVGDSASFAGETVVHATIWNGATPTELGRLPGEEVSVAQAINNAGTTVGYTLLNGSSKLLATI